MNIKWAYGLIAIIYVLLIVLRYINRKNTSEYKKEHSQYKKAFSIKKDFFTTVAIICMVVTVGINGAALIGGKPLNGSSIIVTLLVVGFTLLNSFAYTLFSIEDQNICFFGYTLTSEDIESVQIKNKKSSVQVRLTFTKEIESYNYTKLLVFGEEKEAFVNLIQQMSPKKEAADS